MCNPACATSASRAAPLLRVLTVLCVLLVLPNPAMAAHHHQPLLRTVGRRLQQQQRPGNGDNGSHSGASGGTSGAIVSGIVVGPAPGTRPAAPGQCPPGVLQAECFIDPCAATLCPFGTTCVANYCGGCFADCRRGPLDVDDLPDPRPAIIPPPRARVCSLKRGPCTCSEDCCGSTTVCVAYVLPVPLNATGAGNGVGRNISRSSNATATASSISGSGVRGAAGLGEDEAPYIPPGLPLVAVVYNATAATEAGASGGVEVEIAPELAGVCLPLPSVTSLQRRLDISGRDLRGNITVFECV